MLKFLNCFDLFRFPVELRMEKHAGTYTKIGKIWTLFIFTYILYSLVKSNSFNKKSPKITNHNMKSQRRTYMNFTKKGLSLVFGVTDDENHFYVDPSIFIFQAKQIHGITIDGIYEYNEEILQIKLCDPSDFEDEKIFENLALNK